jgi:hypothetical protein
LGVVFQSAVLETVEAAFCKCCLGGHPGIAFPKVVDNVWVAALQMLIEPVVPSLLLLLVVVLLTVVA